MAVAGLVIMTVGDAFAVVRERLAMRPDITDVELMEEECKLVVVLETASDRVEKAMAECLAWEGVLTVDLAFISYEDELAAGKEILCPPHKARAPRTL